VVLAVFAATGLNYFKNLGFLGPYERELFIVTVVLGALWMHFFGPSVHDLRVHQRHKRMQKEAALRHIEGDDRW
jgi:hypothetical protein